MRNFFARKHSKHIDPAVESQSVQTPSVQQPKSPYVEQYTLVPPKQVFMDYNYFDRCPTVSVKYEASDWGNCVELPTQAFLPYWNMLKSAPCEIMDKPLNRTISVVHLLNDQNMYIFPNPQSPKRLIFAYNAGKLALNMSPEIRRVIVDQIRMYTRE